MPSVFQIVCAGVLLGSTSAALAQKGPAATVDAFHGALKRGDSKGVTALLAPDALIFEAGHIERSAAEYAGGHLAGDAAHAAKTTSSLVARHCVGSPTQAVIMSETLTTTDGRSDPRLGTETMVLSNKSGAWQIAHIHWSSRKLPPGSALPSAGKTSGNCG